VSTTKKQRFAPVPLRALLDQRLGGHHLRVLATVAAHDRLGKNGSGCWASQDRLAALLGCRKSRISKGLSDLRDYGYIASELNPQKRWHRVHRVIYSSDDERFWTSKSVTKENNSFTKSVSMEDNSFSKSVAKTGVNQFPPPRQMSNENNDPQNVTIVRTIESKNREILAGRNCAEARSQATVDIDHAEDYLATCEALAAEAAPTLTLERGVIAEIADNACLPESLNERAAKLLARIPEGKV
jgi:hypothetical protein